MILRQAFMSLAGGNLSILQQGVHFIHFWIQIHDFTINLFVLILFFRCRWVGESLKESIKRHEHFLALQLGLTPGQKVFIFHVQ